MHIVCLDLEGVLVPEIWIAFAESTGIDELRLTTRDISDYDVLMRRRLRILEERGFKLGDIQRVIGTLDPLPGASEFLLRLRELTQVIILSDTFVEFAKPLMRKLGWPSLFCNSLVTADDGTITDYRLRQIEGKKRAVQALQSIGFFVIAAGDSYNDVSMLSQAEAGILFRAPETILEEFPGFASTSTHEELFERIATEIAPQPGR
jgi:phosphoserine/homoserine phosphotransferase